MDAVDKTGTTPLHRACARAETEMAKWLISVGADVAAVDKVGLNRRDLLLILLSGSPA